MPKYLIAIPSCHTLRHWHGAVRETWGKDSPVDVKFFMGNPTGIPDRDEIFLDAGDSLEYLTHKVVAMFQWSLGAGYDFVLKGDLDTLIRPAQMMQSGFEKYDWVGGHNHFFASGGAGYWLSKKAMQIVTEHPIEPGPAEDVNTAHALLEKGINLHHDPRYCFIPGQVLSDQVLTYHLSSVKAWGAKATPEDLRKAYIGTFELPQVQNAMERRFRRLRRR